jgi:AraC-like DNA-binding protein
MVERILTSSLPIGVPTYGGGHVRIPWSTGDQPVRHLSNDWAVYWAASGGARFLLTDGTELVADDGFAILPPSVAAVIEQTRKPLVLWRCNVAFRPCPASIHKHFEEDMLGPGNAASLPLSFYSADAPGVLQAFRRLSLLTPSLDAPSWRLERAVLALMGELAAHARRWSGSKSLGRPIRPTMQEDERLVRILRRIDADPGHRWSVTQLARIAGLSPHRLHGLCKAARGTSLKAYLVRARLELAMRLLRANPNERPATVAEVSGQCGFSSANYFNRVFRHAFQVTPRAYQRGAILGARDD